MVIYTYFVINARGFSPNPSLYKLFVSKGFTGPYLTVTVKHLKKAEENLWEGEVVIIELVCFMLYYYI